MATYKKFDCFAADLANGVHNLGSNALKLLLSQVVPNVADVGVNTTPSPCTIISTGSAVEVAPFTGTPAGYTKGGLAVAITSCTQSSGVCKLLPTGNVAITATAQSAAFRYTTLYNSAAGSAGSRPVIAWWAYASEITNLLVGETFTVDLDETGGILTVTVSDSA